MFVGKAQAGSLLSLLFFTKYLINSKAWILPFNISYKFFGQFDALYKSDLDSQLKDNKITSTSDYVSTADLNEPPRYAM